ncbi:MAG: OmpA family protein [Alphaproteobacteria bacterium]
MVRTAQKTLAVVIIASFALVACRTQDPYTREDKTSRATQGAVIGALGGAIVGALTNTSSGKQAARNALIGAGVGALAGGAVGGYQDRQEARLRERLDQTGVGIRRIGDEIELVMPGDITFATNQAAITSNFYPVLDDVALVLVEFDKTYVQVLGHTDRAGTREYNQRLSQERANSVASYLISRSVMPERLIVQGYGEDRPVVPTPDGVSEQINRRVEIRISPLT